DWSSDVCSSDLADEDPAAEETVTAEEWLAAHREADAAEDPHREITAEHELDDVARERAADVEAVTGEPDIDEAPETNVPDIREVTAEEEATEVTEGVRVPTADETAEAVQCAQRALAELA